MGEAGERSPAATLPVSPERPPPRSAQVGHDSTMNGATSREHRSNGAAVAAKFRRCVTVDGLDEALTAAGPCAALRKCDHYVPMENSAWCAAFVAGAFRAFAAPRKEVSLRGAREMT